MKLHSKTALPEMLHSITMLNPLASSIPLPKEPILSSLSNTLITLTFPQITYPTLWRYAFV